MTPLEQYQQTRRALSEAADAEREAKQRVRIISEQVKEDEYQAVIAVECPYRPCSAGVGERCYPGEGRSVHRYVTHGVRQDLSGVHGDGLRDRMLNEITLNRDGHYR